jgi:hypothetical protein
LIVGRGVYLISGATPPTHLEIRVAWLRLDPARPTWERDGLGEKDGVVSHRSACLLHQLGDIPAPHVELTVPRRLTTRESWVKLRRRPLPAEDVTHVDGLPVTTVNRTVLDLLRDGADSGHVGSVIADAEHRGLLDLEALAGQAGQYANRYAMGKASGAELLSALAAETGQQMHQERALEVLKETAVASATAGYGDAIRRLLQAQVPSEAWNGEHLSRLLTPVDAELSRALAAQINPALNEINKNLTGHLAAQFAPLQDAAARMIAAQISPAVTELGRQLAAQLAPLLQNPSLTAALRERLAEVVLPDAMIAALLDQITAAGVHEPRMALTATPDDEEHTEAST